MPQSTTAKIEAVRTPFFGLDFLKMFLGALLCGLAFSLMAAGVTLAIASVAEPSAAVVATPAG
ncbi:MAG: hypothetical protein JNM52_09675 [Betaproteobacteria bacterium]|nr:hypothetical protein [Betaproteobacteria bacterium]